MGEIARFKGMKISIYPFSDDGNEHPPAHIHIMKDNYRYKFDIMTCEQMFDKKHKKVMDTKDKRMLVEWMKRHKEELVYNWELAEAKQSNFRYIK